MSAIGARGWSGESRDETGIIIVPPRYSQPTLCVPVFSSTSTQTPRPVMAGLEWRLRETDPTVSDRHTGHVMPRFKSNEGGAEKTRECSGHLEYTSHEIVPAVAKRWHLSSFYYCPFSGEYHAWNDTRLFLQAINSSSQFVFYNRMIFYPLAGN